MSEREQVQLERAYVLHQRAYRNTSQLLDCLSEHHGLVTLIAQGSRRAYKGQRAVLQPFLPLRVSWVRRGELGRLTHVELQHAAAPLAGIDSLVVGEDQGQRSWTALVESAAHLSVAPDSIWTPRSPFGRAALPVMPTPM